MTDKVAEVSEVQDVAIITGPSGAGRSTAIHALEDFGFEAIDNLPLSLLPRLFAGQPADRPIAIGIDARTRDFSAAGLWTTIEMIARDPGIKLTLVYVDCGIETLLRRFSETRRRHPLSPNETPIVGIEREQAILDGLKERADILVDTSELSPHELRTELARWFSQETVTELSVSVQSFSYKRGVPRGIDMVIDCRFLNNPYWQPELRPLDGRDALVAAHVSEDPRFTPFFEKLMDLTKLLLPAYKEEGKAYFSIGLGCTGGQHRSVFVTERLANQLADSGWQVSIRHREMERHEKGGSAGMAGQS